LTKRVGVPTKIGTTLIAMQAVQASIPLSVRCCIRATFGLKSRRACHEAPSRFVLSILALFRD
jgi:hypothetical protein